MGMGGPAGLRGAPLAFHYSGEERKMQEIRLEPVEWDIFVNLKIF